MSEKLNDDCISRVNFKLSPQIERLVLSNSLKCSSKEEYCDQNIPLFIQDIKGQDISCVGRENPNCPKKYQKHKLQ